MVTEKWYNVDNKKSLVQLRKHYLEVRKKVHRAEKNQPKQVPLEEAKKQVKNSLTTHNNPVE